jgi:hypothetical protein
MQNWYEDLKDYTPKTWRDVTSVPLTERGPFVVKGETNSKKNLWNTHMFAGDRDFLGRVIGNLLEDSLIKTQSIYIRKWEQFVKLGEGINGLPITREFRFFVAYGEILSSGFYWSSHFEELKERGVSIEAMNPSTVPYPFPRENHFHSGQKGQWHSHRYRGTDRWTVEGGGIERSTNVRTKRK